MVVEIDNRYFTVVEAVGISAQSQPKTPAYEEMAVVTKLIVELSMLKIAIESWQKFRESLEEQAERANESNRAHRHKHEEEEGAYREHVWLCPFIQRQARAFESLSPSSLFVVASCCKPAR